MKILKNPKNLPNICFIVTLMAILLLGLIRTVFFPKDVNVYENRYSEKVLTPTISNIANKTFQNSLDEALADQIPTAQRLKKSYNDINSKFLNKLSKPFIAVAADDNRYISYKGLLLFDKDSLMFYPNEFSERKPRLDAKVSNYNALFTQYPQLDFYAYFIEKDTDINFQTNKKVGSGDYLLSCLQIPESNKGMFAINDYATFRQYFYKTDHHWNHKGAYKAYTEILTILNPHETPLSHTSEKVISKTFRGSKSAMIGDTVIKEDFGAYTYNFPSLKITINGTLAPDYGTQDSPASSSVSYASFYGPDAGELVFDSGRTELKNILIVGESYDNAILKLLASHYNRTHSIDLRNYRSQMGDAFDFDAYIQIHEIDQVLFIGNVDFWVMNEFLLETN